MIEYACFSKSMTILRERGLSLCVTQMNLREKMSAKVLMPIS
ncbi:hypothetical protein SF274771_2879 [Shigella flexneri 2747-71]|nr:hypothetical protein SF274771_2879 [Shigella flexneri 2747-71]EGK21614.1 hypothetical protein SFK218_3348 [Shigella flexneri K-218]EIQ24722.1 hypothetical protein SFK404_3267 [Shigella flexneri K-404]